MARLGSARLGLWVFSTSSVEGPSKPNRAAGGDLAMSRFSVEKSKRLIAKTQLLRDKQSKLFVMVVYESFWWELEYLN